MRPEGFSCSLDALYEGVGISKLQFLIKKRYKIFFSFFSSISGHQNPGSGLDPYSLEMLDPDPYADSVNPDPQHWLQGPGRFNSLLGHVVGALGGAVVPLQVLQEA